MAGARSSPHLTVDGLPDAQATVDSDGAVVGVLLSTSFEVGPDPRAPGPARVRAFPASTHSVTSLVVWRSWLRDAIGRMTSEERCSRIRVGCARSWMAPVGAPRL